MSGIHTLVSAGTRSLGLSILTIEPKYGQSVGLISRELPDLNLVPVSTQ